MDVKERWEEAAKIQHCHEELLLGSPTSYSLVNDPKHIVFVLSRYKFVAKMLKGKQTVLELGAGDGIGLPLIAKEVGHMYTIDWEEKPLESIRRRLIPHFDNVTLMCMDPTKDKLGLKVDAIFNIDFLEHIEPALENQLMENIVQALPENGVFITGTPNISSEKYASESSRIQHINLKGMESLKALMEKHFHNVFMFGMNDEVLHTGFGPMCHYIWSIAIGPKL